MIYIYNDEDTRDTDATDDIGHNADPYYGFKIYNEMTDGNTFVISQDKALALSYGKKLRDIYKDEDEDRRDKNLDKYWSSLPDNVLVTDPEYWAEERINRDTYILYEYDYSDTKYLTTIIGSWSSRF
jgi:hypothetical protein